MKGQISWCFPVNLKMLDTTMLVLKLRAKSINNYDRSNKKPTVACSKKRQKCFKVRFFVLLCPHMKLEYHGSASHTNVWMQHKSSPMHSCPSTHGHSFTCILEKWLPGRLTDRQLVNWFQVPLTRPNPCSTAGVTAAAACVI